MNCSKSAAHLCKSRWPLPLSHHRCVFKYNACRSHKRWNRHWCYEYWYSDFYTILVFQTFCMLLPAFFPPSFEDNQQNSSLICPQTRSVDLALSVTAKLAVRTRTNSLCLRCAERLLALLLFVFPFFEVERGNPTKCRRSRLLHFVCSMALRTKTGFKSLTSTFKVFKFLYAV